MTGLPKEPVFSRTNGNKKASRKNDGNGKVDGFGDDSVEQVRKSGKLKKSAKSQKLSKSEKSKGKKSKKPPKSGNLPNFDAKNSRPSFLTPKARSAFNSLWLAFIKAPIIWHFDPKCHIWIKTDVSSYAIDNVLSSLASWTSLDRVVTKADLGQWHLIAFFFRKIIPTKTRYKTYNDKLLAIIEKYKTWCHYLEDCKHEVFVLMDHNNFCHFINIKSLSSKQVR